MEHTMQTLLVEEEEIVEDSEVLSVLEEEAFLCFWDVVYG
jgi:hypothetical protein